MTQARLPIFYTDYGVQDVAEKRYEMIVLHMVIVLERLRTTGEDVVEVGQELVEAFVDDLDGSIREMAIGDPKVPNQVRKAAAGLLDRTHLYGQAFDGSATAAPDRLAAGDDMTLPALLGELLFDDGDTVGASAMARYTCASRTMLGTWTLDDGVEALSFARPEHFLAG
ncbi:MAG: ubiquinol-cytochrome C chaperone family protein [Hyphomicrobiaceae bacterium]